MRQGWAGQGRAEQGMAGQDRARQGRAGQGRHIQKHTGSTLVYKQAWKVGMLPLGSEAVTCIGDMQNICNAYII